MMTVCTYNQCVEKQIIRNKMWKKIANILQIIVFLKKKRERKETEIYLDTFTYIILIFFFFAL